MEKNFNILVKDILHQFNIYYLTLIFIIQPVTDYNP